jgi:hypothetical protein
MELDLQSLFGLHVATYWLSWLYWKTDFELCPSSALRCIFVWWCKQHLRRCSTSAPLFDGNAPLVPLSEDKEHSETVPGGIAPPAPLSYGKASPLHLCLMVLAPPASPIWWYSTSCTSVWWCSSCTSIWWCSTSWTAFLWYSTSYAAVGLQSNSSTYIS